MGDVIRQATPRKTQIQCIKSKNYVYGLYFAYINNTYFPHIFVTCWHYGIDIIVSIWPWENQLQQHILYTLRLLLKCNMSCSCHWAYNCHPGRDIKPYCTPSLSRSGCVIVHLWNWRLHSNRATYKICNYLFIEIGAFWVTHPSCLVSLMEFFHHLDYTSPDAASHIQNYVDGGFCFILVTLTVPSGVMWVSACRSLHTVTETAVRMPLSSNEKSN